MATKKLLKKLLINGVTYYLPSSDEYVDKSSNQTIGGTKTFTTSPVVPSKSTAAGNNPTTIATEAQVALKQDALTAGSNITIESVGGVLTISAANTEYTEVSKNDLDTGTSTTAGIIAAKSIADYVKGKIGSAVNYQGQVADYDSLPANPTKGDMYNVVAAHATAPKFDAGTNVVWNWTGWDPMAEMVDLSNLVTLTTAQTISGKKTFTTEFALPSKTADATNDGTKPATEAQVYKKQDKLTAGANVTIETVGGVLTIKATDTTYENKTAASGGTDLSLVTTGDKYNWDNKADTTDIGNATITLNQWVTSNIGSFSTNQSTAGTLNLQGNVPVTEAAYGDLPATKETDSNTYIIYEEVTVS